MSTFTVTFEAYDRLNKRNLYFKTDGKRFASDRTLKICCDVKYDVTVTVRPSVSTLKKLIVGGDEITPDDVEQKEDSTVYRSTWFTNGYTTTSKGQRHGLRFAYVFDSLELAYEFQVKFYPVNSGSHLTWGTEIHRLILEAKRPSGDGGATPFLNLVPTNITFR